MFPAFPSLVTSSRRALNSLPWLPGCLSTSLLRVYQPLKKRCKCPSTLYRIISGLCPTTTDHLRGLAQAGRPPMMHLPATSSSCPRFLRASENPCTSSPSPSDRVVRGPDPSSRAEQDSEELKHQSRKAMLSSTFWLSDHRGDHQLLCSHVLKPGVQAPAPSPPSSSLMPQRR